MNEKYNEKLNTWLTKRKFARKCDLIRKTGMSYEMKYSKMANARIFKPSELEIYNSIKKANSLKNNIRKYMVELNIFEEEIEEVIKEIEAIECMGIVDCLIIANRYYKIGCILDKKFVEARYRIIYEGLNSIEFIIAIFIGTPLVWLILRLFIFS